MRLKYTRPLIAGIVNPAADPVRHKYSRAKWHEQSVVRLLEPVVNKFIGDNHRHAVVDAFQVHRRLRGQDCNGGFRFISAVEVPDPRHQKGILLGQVDVKGLLAPVLRLPLIVTGCRNQAAPLVHGIPKERLVESAFHACIDGVYFWAVICNKVGYVAPGHVQQFQVITGIAIYRYLLPRRDVIAGLEWRSLADLDRACQAPDGGVMDKVIAATHFLPIWSVVQEACHGECPETTESTMKSLLRIKEVMTATGLSRSSIYKYISLDKFPRPVPIGERAAACVSDEIESWIIARVEQRDRTRNDLP